MLEHLLSILLIFLLSILFIIIVLYILSCYVFNLGVEEEFNIDKLYAYECGFSPYSDARDAVDIKFYLVAILFLLFDLEIAFLFPFSVSLAGLTYFDFISVFAFIAILTVGFFYELKKGGLDW